MLLLLLACGSGKLTVDTAAPTGDSTTGDSPTAGGQETGGASPDDTGGPATEDSGRRDTGDPRDTGDTGASGDSGLTEPVPGRDYPLDDLLTLPDIQALGTHNSYHVEPDIVWYPDHAYTQDPLDVQLETHGVRQFELDLHLRVDGGFEIFHIPLIDQETTCQLFVDCLGTIKLWSDANPTHAPVVIWLEPKDDVDWLDWTLESITGRYDDLEAEILSVFPADRILSPDEVRGDHGTLPQAIAADGWPTLGALRGRVMFALLDSGSHREDYMDGADNLAGRLMFVDSDSADDPFAATFKINNAQSDAALVSELVQAGFVVTSNVDSAGSSDGDNADKLADSLDSGANFLSSDFPAPVEGRAYWAEIPGGTPARCNPVRAPAECGPEDIESL